MQSLFSCRNHHRQMMSICHKAALQILALVLRQKQRLYSVERISGSLPQQAGCQFSNQLRMYSDDKKSSLKDLLKIVEQKNTSGQFMRSGLKGAFEPNTSASESMQTNRRVKHLLPHMFSEDGKLKPDISVEQKLKGLMLIWEVEVAVEVLKEAVINGTEPHQNVILDLLQQLANLGEVECILELHELLKDRGLTNNLRFYHCLRDAYFNSGRIEEGVGMLRIIYHSTRDFNDADMFFTLIATMTMKHFEDRVPLIESFVDDLVESDPPVPYARASLWSCFVLAEKFDKAEKLLQEHEEVKTMIPGQVTKLLQLPLQVDYNKELVFLWVLELPYIKPGLKANVFDRLIRLKMQEKEWHKALQYLSIAMDLDMKLHQHTVQVFLTEFFSQLSWEQFQRISEWMETLEKDSDQTEETDT